MHNDSHLPYSKAGLENLAAALGVNSAFLWVNPTGQRLDIKRVEELESGSELEEDEE